MAGPRGRPVTEHQLSELLFNSRPEPAGHPAAPGARLLLPLSAGQRQVLAGAGVFKAQSFLKLSSRFKRQDPPGSELAEKPRGGHSGSGASGEPPPARSPAPVPAGAHLAGVSPDTDSRDAPPPPRLSPPACPRSSCSSRCSHALPSSQSLTSWSHPARRNHPTLCGATGGCAARGSGGGARGRGGHQSARGPSATPAKRKPVAAGRGVRGGGGGGGTAGGGSAGDGRRPRCAAPGSASAGSERAACAKRVQLS